MFQFLYLGNLIPQKGLSIIVEACALLKQSTTIFQCHIVGGGTKELSVNRLNQTIQEHHLTDYIKVHGPQYGKDKERFFHHSNAFIFPTSYHNECFPLVLLEAMQHSLPIIATPVGAIPDLVSDGDNGFLVPENDPQALANAMLQFIANPELAQKMGREGNTRYLQSYTRQNFEIRLQQILFNV